MGERWAPASPIMCFPTMAAWLIPASQFSMILFWGVNLDWCIWPLGTGLAVSLWGTRVALSSSSFHCLIVVPLSRQELGCIANLDPGWEMRYAFQSMAAVYMRNNSLAFMSELELTLASCFTLKGNWCLTPNGWRQGHVKKCRQGHFVTQDRAILSHRTAPSGNILELHTASHQCPN